MTKENPAGAAGFSRFRIAGLKSEMPIPEKNERKKAIQTAQRFAGGAARKTAVSSPPAVTPETLSSVNGDATSALANQHDIVCYLDDSGTGNEPILSMAGYVAPYGKWLGFEQAAGEIFNSFGVSELHGKEFNDTKDQFKGWSRRKKEAFVAQLYLHLAGSGVLGIDCGITRIAYNKARFEYGHYPNESGYGNCFRRIVETIMRSDMMKHHSEVHKATLSFVVEAGNKNDADLLRIFDELKFHPNHVGVVNVMKSVSFASKGSTIALQMADFLAFHSRRFKSQCENARKYLPLSDLQRMIFKTVDTKTSLNHGYLTNEEIEAGYRDPDAWREITNLDA